MNPAIRRSVFVSRRIPQAALARLQACCSVRQWDQDEPPPREEYLQAVRGVEALFCLLTDRVDAELLDAAGRSHRSGRGGTL